MREVNYSANFWAILIGASLITGNPNRVTADTPTPPVTTMIFCNGNMATPSGLTTTQINGFRASGMNTLILFTMGVAANGDFTYGGTICSNGVYVGPSNWGPLLNQCRVQPSSVNRIEMCIGAWGDTSWVNIKNLIAANGTGSDTVLYRNLVALKNALGIEAIDNDDELAYDVNSTIKFGQMCGAVGLKLTLCPYTRPSYWQAVKAGLGDTCDRVYLQCYDGGKYENPATWNTYFGGLKVIPGYWDWERDTTFLTKMQAWSTVGCTGGFLWPSDTGGNPPAGPGEMLQYAQWIRSCYEPVVTPVTAMDVVGSKVSFVVAYGGENVSYQWQMIRNGATNNIPGATNTTLTLSNLQLTNTATYQVVVSNALGVLTSMPRSLAVFSAPTAVNNIITSHAAQTGMGNGYTLNPTWAIAPGSVMYGQSPNTMSGNFSLEASGRNISSLTDGRNDGMTLIAGTSGNTTSTNYVTCGNGSSAGSLLIYTLTNSSAAGYNLTNIVVYGGWADAGRDQQAYSVYYSKVTAPSAFIYLGSVNYNPANAANAPSATRASLRPASGALASNVAAVRFDFTNPSSENGYCGYAEIGLFGIPISPVVATNTLPVTATDVVGSQVTFTAAFTAASAMTYQWQKISGGATNNVAGATNTTLTLTNLQLTDTASYRLQASNANDVACSAASSLTVSSVPAAVNNVIASYAAQTGLGSVLTNFSTTWTVMPGSLISGQSPNSIGSGNFSLYGAGLVAALTDDSFGWLNYWPNIGGSPAEVTCGGGAGQSVTYMLTGSSRGYNLTNIVVYGGWGDAGRDQQAYTVSYSTVAAPTAFITLGSVNYNPANASGVQSATRATLTPVNGVLATNVGAIKFDFTTPAGENGYSGYSEIDVYGIPTPPPVATTPPHIAVQLITNNLTLSWPSDHVGWSLQVQTNEPGQGLGTNWSEVAGSTLTNQMSLPINPASGSVFYRMFYKD